MRRNFPIVLLCVISGIATIAAGNLYWGQKKQDFFRRLYTRKSFSLVDGEGKIFNTKDFSKGKKILIVFTPDALPVPAVKPFRSLLKDLAREQGSKVEITIVSRVHGDIVKNFLHAAGFRGRLLTDPSGSFARYLGARESMDPLYDWTIATIDKDLNLQWSVAGREVPEYGKLRDKL